MPAALATYAVAGTVAVGAVEVRVWLVAAFGGALVLCVGRWRGSGAAWVAVVAAALAAATTAAHIGTGRAAVEDAIAAAGEVRVVGTVALDPRQIGPSPFDRDDARWLVSLAVEGIGPGEGGGLSAARATIALVGGDQWAHLRVGDRIEFTGHLDAVQPGRSAAIAWDPHLDGVVPASGLDAAVADLRDGFRDATLTLPDEVRALTVGMTIGDTSAMNADQRRELNVAGLTHLTAVSGAQFAMLALAVGAGVRALRWNRRWRVLILGLVMAGFVALVHPEPSVLRAAWMGGILALALWWGRPGQALPALSTAVIGLLIADPFLALAPGFALSVAATAAIVLWAPVLAITLARVLPPRLARALAVPIAAQAACTPILILINPGVGLYGVIANLLAMPFAALVTALGLASVAVSPLWEGGGVALAQAAGMAARPVAGIAHVAASLPGAWLPWPSGVVGAALAAAVVVALIVATSARRTVGWARLSFLVATIALVAASPPVQASIAEANRRAPDDWAVAVCDVGQGDMILIRAGPSSAVVVDTGPEQGGAAACLARHGVTDIPLLVLTHPHADHTGGLADVLARTRVGEAWISSAPGAERDAEVLAAAGVAATTPAAGTSVAVGQARLTVWHTAAADPQEESEVNDASLVVWGNAGGVTFLALGDLEDQGQGALARANGAPAPDVLKVAHHGSARVDAGFLTSAARGAVAVISVGEDNPYGHPASETLALLESAGAMVFRTDVCGDVDVSHRQGVVVTARCF